MRPVDSAAVAFAIAGQALHRANKGSVRAEITRASQKVSATTLPHNCVPARALIQGAAKNRRTHSMDQFQAEVDNNESANKFKPLHQACWE